MNRPLRTPVGGCAPPSGKPNHQRGRLSEKLIDVLWSEVEDAAGRAVITEAESEQLLARLVLVIDQALSATGTSP